MILSLLQGWLLLGASKSYDTLIHAMQTLEVCKFGSRLFAHENNLSPSRRYWFSDCAEITLPDEEFLPEFLLNAISVPLILQISCDGLVSVGRADHFDALTT